MYSKEILERFKDPQNVGGLRGANGTGKAGDLECGEIVKIYILVDENGIISTARFKTYGGVIAIAGSDVACDLLNGSTLEDALSITAQDINEKLEDVPEGKLFVAEIIEEAIKNAVEDYYKKQDKE